MRRRLLIAFACCFCYVLGGVVPGISETPSTLQQLQDRLNELGRAILLKTGELQSLFRELAEQLNKQLVITLMGAYRKLEKIHHTTGLYIENYNMTDEYCMKVIGYLYWAHAEEAIQSMQVCSAKAVTAVGVAQQKRVSTLLEQSRLKATEVTMLVVRELAKSSVREEVEQVVAEEVPKIEAEWLETKHVLENGVNEFSIFRDTTVTDTEQCTKAVIDQYAIDMGYIEFYLNKNKNCRK